MKNYQVFSALIVLVTASSLAFAGPGEGKGKGKGKPGPDGKRKPTPERLLKHLDKDGNGVISKSEAPEKMAKRFGKMDTDKSGTISLEEIKAAFKKRAEQGGKGPGGKGPGGKGKPSPENFIKRFDKNNDGSIAKSELPEQMRQKFDRLDKNGDGVADLNEVKAMFAKRAERGGKGAGEKGPGGKRPGGKKPAN